MKVDIEIIQDFDLPDTSAGRSIGIHNSNIIRGIAQESGLLKLEECEEIELIPTTNINDLPQWIKNRIHMGLAWERYYIPLQPDIVDHPEELCVDDIYMSRDGESIDTGWKGGKKVHYPVLHEVKFTGKSTRTVGDLHKTNRKDQFMWVSQIKSYCNAMSVKYTRLCLDAKLHVMFSFGNYMRPFKSELRVFHVQFTQQEIRDNWKLITEYRDYKLKCVANPELLKPIDFGSWNGVK